MKLEVGKKYVDRANRVVEILHSHEDKFLTYTREENFYSACFSTGQNMDFDSDRDLIKECKEPRTKDVWLEFTSLSHDGIVVTDLEMHDEKPPRRGMSIAIKKVTITEGEFDD